MNRNSLLWIILWSGVWSFSAFSAENMPLVDGVEIQAVENIVFDKMQQVNLLIGVYPFNAFYNGYAVGLDTITRLGSSFSWRILKGEYFSSVENSLRTDLANFYTATPVALNELNFSLSTEMLLHVAEGKFLMFSSWLKTFDFSVFLGPGMLKATQTTGLSINFGCRLKAMAGGDMHWFFEIEDHYAVSSNTSFVIFTLGTGVSF